jgi:predicted DNA-binding transcriptional regulator YafY
MSNSKNYDKKLFRLVDMLRRFHDGERIGIKALSEEYSVSAKTISRDLKQLEGIIPIEKIGQKWQMQVGFALDKNRSYEEILALDILDGIAKGLGKNFGTVSHTLLSKLQNEHDNPIYSKIEIEDIYDKVETINALQRAIKQHRVATFIYKGKERFVEPYKITTFEGFWYLYGQEQKDQKLKTYYLKDIDTLTLREDTFKPEQRALDILRHAINVWFEPNTQPFEVKLIANTSVAKYFDRRPLSASQIVTRRFEDGSVELTLYATSSQEIIYEIKKWLPELIVVEPDWLVHKMISITQTFLSKQAREGTE